MFKRTKILWLLLGAIAIVVFLVFRFGVDTNQKNNFPNKMRISSPSFNAGQELPVPFTCQGDGHNPSLAISGVPGEAVSLAFIMDDPDAPKGTFVHWIVWDIGRDTTRIDEGLPPPMSIEGQNSLGQVGYVAPCPPSGTHRYYFRLYALDKDLELDEQTTKEELLTAMTGHIIDQAEIIGLVTASKP